MRIPEVKVTAHFGDRASVGWEDAERRYHIWVGFDGQPLDDTIHSNPHHTPDPRVNYHRALSQSAKKWAPLVSAILAKVRDEDLIADARERQASKEKEEHAARMRQSNAHDLERLGHAIETLPAGVAMLMRDLPEATKLAFVAALDHGSD